MRENPSFANGQVSTGNGQAFYNVTAIAPSITQDWSLCNL